MSELGTEKNKNIATAMERSQRPNLYFNDPRLAMTIGGRIFARIVAYIGYLVLFASVFTFLISDVNAPRAFGVVLLLFLIDRLIHLREADRELRELPVDESANLARFLRPAAFSVIEKSFDKCSITKRNFFLEVVIRLLDVSAISEGLERLDIKKEEFKQKAEEFLAQSAGNRDSGVPTKEELRDKVEFLVLRAFGRAMAAGHRFIEPSDLFSALPLVGEGYLNRIFNLFSIDVDDLELALVFITANQRSFLERLPQLLGGFSFESQSQIRHRVMNRAWTARPTPVLDSFSSDFTDLARRQKIGFLIGHKAEFDRLLDVLARPTNPNALLVGEPGIGKETLVSHLALRLVKDEVPPDLFDKRLVALEINNLAAGAPPHELQARVQRIAEEIITAGNVILFIPDIHNLVNTSGTAYLSAADALMPIIRSNAFPVIGATYPREFKEFIEPRSDFTGTFEVIRVNEITEVEAEKVLIYESLILENRTRIIISLGAIKKSVKLARKYFRNKFLPSSAEEILKSALAEAQRKKEKVLGPERVVSAAEAKVNVPIHEAGEAEAETLLNLENIIHERLIDQEEAVKSVSNALREYRSGLSRPGGPIASFLFVGPTGVGKTELAKILAKIQFGSLDAMIRFDMTEYQDKQSFFRFIGSPDGKISGSLTEAVLQKPYSLILLDEFEKAFPDILNLFLQVFDDGRLTDNLGQLVDFQNTIIICTSNAHSDIINEALNHGQSMNEIADYLKKKLTDVFRPELLNRFSRTIVFKDLSLSDVEKIAVLNVNNLAKNVEDQGIVLAFEPTAIKQLAKLGYDPAFGARPMRRVIDDKIRAPLAEMILSKKVGWGGRIKLIFDDQHFKFVEE